MKLPPLLTRLFVLVLSSTAAGAADVSLFPRGNCLGEPKKFYGVEENTCLGAGEAGKVFASVSISRLRAKSVSFSLIGL